MIPLVLALEPDTRQAAVLKRVMRDHVQADLTVVDSRDAAMAAIAERLPDVILLTALLSPRDEDELFAHLRSRSDAEHVQTHSIPQLAHVETVGVEERVAPKGGLFGKLRRKKTDAEPVSGCDPVLFAQEINAYLQRAAELKAEGGTQKPVLEIASRVDSTGHLDAFTAAAIDTVEPAAASAWSSPFEWRPTADTRAPALTAATDAPEIAPAEIDYETRARDLERHREEDEAREVARRRFEEEREAERLHVEAERHAIEAERQRIEVERQRMEAEAAAALEREAERVRIEAEREKERVRQEAERQAERLRLEAEREAERVREEAEREKEHARAEAERLRLEAERQREDAARQKQEAERRRKEAEEARLERERVRLEAEREAAALREQAEIEAERLRLEAEIENERRLEEVAREAERIRLEAEEHASRMRAQEEARRQEEDARRQEEDARRRAQERAARDGEKARKRSAERAAERARKHREAVQDAFAEFRLEAVEQPIGTVRLVPLAVWARVEQPRAAAPAAPVRDELRELMKGLSIPLQVAGITYARGCRIRRVRVPALPASARKGTKEPVILSRRALEEIRTTGAR